MTSVTNIADIATAAYRLHTGGMAFKATEWQAALYAHLSTRDSDAGYLLSTPTGAGKIEAVVIPALGLSRGGAPRRLFLIGPDDSPLDDYLYRLVPYIRASVAGDETPRTLCVDLLADNHIGGNLCRRYFPSGAEDHSIERNPLEADVDLVLTTLSSFRALFFGGGGMHALRSNASPAPGLPVRRDMFYFDEAHRYDPDSFAQFHKLVEFLFAQDADIIVGTTTMPQSYQDEIGFLESMDVTDQLFPRTLTIVYHSDSDIVAGMEREVRSAFPRNSRVIAATESVVDAQILHSRLAEMSPRNTYLYHPNQQSNIRLQTYGHLRELEKKGEGYLLFTTGGALESSDLDTSAVISSLCSPENLIRRAGRCNRRGEFQDAQIIVVGRQLSADTRVLPRAESYLGALAEYSGAAFDPEIWKAFI